MNEILLYSELNEWTVTDVLNSLNTIQENQVYTMRFYCPGGEVNASWGVPAKMNELRLKGCRSIAKVDGMAASMAGVLLGFFDEREGLDVSKIMIHKAAYSKKDWNGKKIVYTDEQIQLLNNINKELKDKLSQVIDNEKLKSIKNVTLDDLFNEENERIDCWLTAVEAKEIGLLTKVINLDTHNANRMAKAVACLETSKIKGSAPIVETNKNKKMTAQEFKEQNPEAYNELRESLIAELTPTATVTTDSIKAEVEKQLKALNLKTVEDNQPDQVALAQAKAEAEAKKLEEGKVMNQLDADLENIVTGKIK